MAFRWMIVALIAMLPLGAAATCVDGQPLRGVNLSGAESNPKAVPGILGKTHMYPRSQEINYFRSIGMNVIRVPLRWQRLQFSLMGPLDKDTMVQIHKVIAAAGSDMCVILDVHNYGNYRGAPIGSPLVPEEAFIDLWRRMAREFPDTKAVAFDLMNEPNALPISDWARVAQNTVNALRADGAKNLILVGGGMWSGAHSWFNAKGGASNAESFAQFSDPLGRTLIEMHQYADADGSGTHAECISSGKLTAVFDRVTTWAKDNNQKLFLGEFGVSDNPQCLKDLLEILAGTSQTTVWVGWTYWVAGPWYVNYPYTIQPVPGRPSPQTDLLKSCLQGQCGN